MTHAFPPGGPDATRRALGRAGDARAIVLVEGISDQIALETLAERRGRELEREGVVIVPIGGAQAIGRFLSRFGPAGSDARLAGLCDAGEEAVFRRSLERAGLGSILSRSDMEQRGFFVCVADLEDELIRALGPAAVEAVLDAHGDLGPFRTFQKQPAWRGRRVDAQLRRFLCSADRRSIRYAVYSSMRSTSPECLGHWTACSLTLHVRCERNENGLWHERPPRPCLVAGVGFQPATSGLMRSEVSRDHARLRQRWGVSPEVDLLEPGRLSI